MANKNAVIGGIISLVIGGTVFSVNSADIARNFSLDTGMSQQQAQEYIANISKDDLVSFDVVGASLVTDGQDIIASALEIDCIKFEYTWETESVTCEDSKSELIALGWSEVRLGNAYKVLATSSATSQDIAAVITYIDTVNKGLNTEVVRSTIDEQTLSELKQTNSFNKALLQSALDSKER